MLIISVVICLLVFGWLDIEIVGNIANNIILGDSFEKKQTLANNNYVLNDAPAESRQKVIF